MLLREGVPQRARPPGARPRAGRVGALGGRGGFVHGRGWGMSPRGRGLAAGARPPRQGRNDFGHVGWGGPCPPFGTKHRYLFVLYALGNRLRLPNGATAREFQRAVGSAGIVRQTGLIGTYRRRAGTS